MLVHGRNIIIYEGGVAIAAAKSCEIRIQCDAEEVSSPDNGEWRDYIKGRKAWEITDRFNNRWEVVFNGNVNEWTISGCVDYEPFKVFVYMTDSHVEIHKAYHNGRTIKADRLLKKYINLASLVNCYHKFGYLKL